MYYYYFCGKMTERARKALQARYANIVDFCVQPERLELWRYVDPTQQPLTLHGDTRAEVEAFVQRYLAKVAEQLWHEHGFIRPTDRERIAGNVVARTSFDAGMEGMEGWNPGALLDRWNAIMSQEMQGFAAEQAWKHISAHGNDTTPESCRYVAYVENENVLWNCGRITGQPGFNWRGELDSYTVFNEEFLRAWRKFHTCMTCNPETCRTCDSSLARVQCPWRTERSSMGPNAREAQRYRGAVRNDVTARRGLR